MIRIKPIIADVTDMTVNEIVEKFGELYGIYEKDSKVIAEIGYILTEEETSIIKQEE